MTLDGLVWQGSPVHGPQEVWQRERLLEALDSYSRGLSPAPQILKWTGTGVLGRDPEAEARDEREEAEAPMTFVASTEDVDRHGNVILVKGWRLDAYRKNPVFLWAHDYARPAIGRATRVWSTATPTSVGAIGLSGVDMGKPALMVEVEYAPTGFAREVAALYRAGYQRGVSVGFRAHTV